MAASCLPAAGIPDPIDSFVRLSDDEGLTHSDVRALTQDKEGFMWFGTRLGGLVRYDGYEFKTYQHDPTNPATIGNRVIWSVLVDRSGTLWVGTEGGMSRFDRKTETFTHYRHDPKRDDTLPHNVVTCLFEDSAGRLWVGSRGGLSLLDREKGTFVTYQRPATIEGSTAKDTFRSIIEDSSTGLLWLGASEGVAAFDPRTGAFASYVHQPDMADSIGSNAVNKVIRAEDGVFWALTEQGLYSFVPSLTKVPEHALLKPHISFTRFDQPSTGSQPGLNFLRDGLFDRHKRLWLASRAGLQLFDRETGTFRRFHRRPGDRSSLSDDITHTVFEDQSGNLWIGTFAGGVSRLRSEAKPFTVHRHDPANPRSLSDDRVAGLAIDPAGRLWAATTNGLNRYDADGWRRFLHDPGDPHSLPTNDLANIAAAPNGDIWVGTPYAGAIKFDGQRFTRMPSSPASLPAPSGPQSFTGWQVNSFLADQRGGVWIAARAYGLDYYDGSRFHHYAPRTELTAEGTVPGFPTSNALLGLSDQSGDIWYITAEAHGLVHFDATRRTFTTYQVPTGTAAAAIRTLQCIARGSDGSIWVGAVDGLVEFNPRTRKFQREFTTAHGLPSNAVTTIVADRRGHLWIGTDSGLADFDPRAETFRVYEKPDGLPSNVFSQRAGVLGPDGRVHFGTRAGIVSFMPDELRNNPNPPPVVITDLRWLGHEHGLGADGPAGQWPAASTLRVPAGQLGFAVKFAALDFAAPEKNQYRYRLEGFDSDWVTSPAKVRTATYTSLPPGSYTLRVQASNADGVWNHRGAMLPIVIEPHVWETAWFRTCLGLLTIGLLAAGLQVRLRTIRHRNALLQRQVSQRTSELQKEIAVRERVEAALRESHDELERRVRERTAELAATNASLEAEISERRNIEAQLRQSQKMEAIGQLAGGIAHDFNNLLTVILGQSELLSMDSLPADMRGIAVRDIRSAAQRASKLTRQLLVFSRREPMRLAVVDLNAVVGGDIDLLRRIIGEDIALGTSLSAGPLHVCADASMIEQLLLNLALNARDAMPRGGRLTIATSQMNLAAPDPGRSANALRGDYARISISDTGTGIPPEVLPRIFEPFFTTKERGKGTGLGLAISHGIVQEHRGWVEVDTRLGEGTTFHVWFPLHHAAAPQPCPEHKPSVAAPRGATVLLVEDEQDVRSIASRVLKHNGYRVIEASCGAEALALWAAHRDEISVLLTDIVMPGQPDGRDLAKRLAQEKSGLCVITMSGYDPSARADSNGQVFRGFHLRKPFTTTDLLAAFSEAMRDHSRS